MILLEMQLTIQFTTTEENLMMIFGCSTRHCHVIADKQTEP